MHLHNKGNSPTVLSLFTGAGGMDSGFEAAGYKLLGAVEIENWACSTLRKNHAGITVIGPPQHSGNLKELSAEDILSFCKVSKKDIDVIVGGPPCQPFSQAATQRFLKSDPRFKRTGFDDSVKGTLLFDFVRLVKEIQPRVFVLENVSGLKTMDGGNPLKLALSELSDQGYKFTYPTVIDAANYGIPQFRQRVIIWGSKRIENPTLPEPTHGKIGDLYIKPYNTVAQALTGVSNDLLNHVTRDHQPSSIERYRALCFGQRDKLGRTDRLDPLKPSKTVIAGGMNGGGRSHLHPFIARTLSVRECARLQTFADDYIFEASIARQFTQVGNAVPPLLAENIARHIQHLEFQHKIEGEFIHGKYLQHSESLLNLAEKLLIESRKEKPEWIYFDSVSDNPLIRNNFSVTANSYAFA